jgi:hypothetical protein
MDLMFAPHHGTLIVLLIRADGVYLSADSRRGKVHDDAEKLVRLGPQTLLGLRGMAMLTDTDGSKSILAANYLLDKLSEPIAVERYASPSELGKSEVAASQMVRNTLEPFVKAFEREWNSVDLTSEAQAEIQSGEATFGLTLAQAEADGWLLAVDLQYKIDIDEHRHVAISPAFSKLIQHGPYAGDKIQPFWPPGCERVIQLGPPEESEDPCAFLQTVFAAVIDRSSDCAKDIGLPVDIAKVERGAITPLVMKKTWR